jgi:7-cyano-7-deazaguanine reductase
MQISGTLPFFGADIWTAYEISWLNLRGKPQVAIATFMVPADSPNIIESKSFKLYLNSFNQERLESADELAEAAPRPVGRRRRQRAGDADRIVAVRPGAVRRTGGLLLDRLDVEIEPAATGAHPDGSLLRANTRKPRSKKPWCRTCSSPTAR